VYRRAAEHGRAGDSRSAPFRFAPLRSTRAPDADRWAASANAKTGAMIMVSKEPQPVQAW